MSHSAPVETDLNLPVFRERQVEHWPSKMSWVDAVRSFAAAGADGWKKLDSPEQRLRDKNPARFRLP